MSTHTSDSGRPDLTRRESQILDLLYRLGEADAVQIEERLHDGPSNAAVRRMLTILEEKGHVTHRKEGRKFVYRPVVRAEAAGRHRLRNLLSTFFDGSIAKAVVAEFNTSPEDISIDELDELARVIEIRRAAALRAREEEES